MPDVARHPDDYARSMRRADVRERRRAMLKCPRIAPLTVYAAELRSMNRGDVPDFDPLNGGTEAEILFLFEKPGRVERGTI